MNNTAYIDVFCSFLFGQLTYNKINPSFPLYYGAMNGIGNYKYDISEEYDDIKVDKIFNETVGKGFDIDDKTGHIYDRDAMQLWGREYAPGWQPKI